MKIHYKNSHHVLGALVLGIWGYMSLFWFREPTTGYVLKVLLTFNLLVLTGNFFYDLKFQYLSFENGILYKNTFWAKLFFKKKSSWMKLK